MPQYPGIYAHRIVVLELEDVVPRICAQRPNLFVGVTTKFATELADGLNEGKYRPTWARNRVVGTRNDLTVDGVTDRSTATGQCKRLIADLRKKAFTVNRNTSGYRTYVINLHDPNIADPGCGYVYVGQTSKTPETRLDEHLSGARSSKGHRLAARVVERFGIDLNQELMTQRIYLTKKQAETAERRLADRLRQQGYIVKGGH